MVFVRKFKGPCSEERVDCPVRLCPVTISKFRNLPKHLQTKHKFPEPIIKSIINQIRNCIADVEEFCERNLPKNDSPSRDIQGNKLPPIIDHHKRKNLSSGHSTTVSGPIFRGKFPVGCSTQIVSPSTFSLPQLCVVDKHLEPCHRVSRVEGYHHHYVKKYQISPNNNNIKNAMLTTFLFLCVILAKKKKTYDLVLFSFFFC